MNKPYIIAEIASAHEGQLNLALEIVDYAVKAGADAVKFQIFNRDELLTKFNPYFGEFGEIELSPQSWREILEEASSKEIDIIVEPYDVYSFNLAENTGFVTGYKIPTASIGETDLLEKVKETRKPVFIGIGGAEMKEIEQAVCLFEGSDVTLMSGTQNFPTRLEDSKILQIHQLNKAFGCAVGYADHVDAEDKEMVRLVPALAVVIGATVIEKHITDDRSRKGRDHHSALNPGEFRSFVQLIRHLPTILGKKNDWSLSDTELKYRRFTKKQAVAARDIAPGTKLEWKDVVFKRTDEEGLSSLDISDYIGRKLVPLKKTDVPLRHEDFIES